LGGAACAMESAGTYRRGHGETQDCGCQYIFRVVECFSPLTAWPPGSRPAYARLAELASRCVLRTFGFHHQRRTPGPLHTASRDLLVTRSSPGRGRTSGRDEWCLRVLRQDRAGSTDGGGAAKHSQHHGGLRLSTGRRVQGPAHRHRRGVRERGQSCDRRNYRSRARRYVRRRHRRPGVCAGMGTPTPCTSLARRSAWPCPGRRRYWPTVRACSNSPRPPAGALSAMVRET